MTDDEFAALADMARLRGLRVRVSSDALLIVDNMHVHHAELHEKRIVTRADDLHWALGRLAPPFFGEQK